MADQNAAESLSLNNTMNDTAANKTVSGRAAATPEGLMIAYASLIVMALLPIWVGSFKSVLFSKKQRESGEKIESMSKKDAAMFPLIASGALFGLYVFFKLFSKEYINLLLTVYFFLIGVVCVTNLLRPFVAPLIPANFPNSNYHATLDEGEGESKASIFDLKFDRIDLVCLALSAVIGVWYLMKKHWIANNIFGLAFSLTGVEALHLNSFPIGCILLGGLFFYDIFWVFGTDVMVTVATSFEAPIKVIFPMDFLEHGINGKNFAMLGLGDIVIPGIFIALLLRFDVSKGKDSYAYFYTCFVAYFLGLILTVVILHVFKSAQPALLYLVPACIGSALLVALVKGEITELLKYEDHPEEMLSTGQSTTDSKKNEKDENKPESSGQVSDKKED